MKTKSITLELNKGEKITLKGKEKHLISFLCEIAIMAYDANVYNLNNGYKNTANNYMNYFKQFRELTNNFTNI